LAYTSGSLRKNTRLIPSTFSLNPLIQIRCASGLKPPRVPWIR
jgi:hypothetical protein